MMLWHDIIEIACFSLFFYYIAVWLSYDTQKNLLAPFYAYWGILGASYVLELTTVFTLLLYATPCIAVLFVLVHQKSLQANFITLHKITPRDIRARTNWIEEITRTTLYAINKQCDITFVIEHTQSLEDFITTPFRLSTDIQKGIFEPFITSTIPQSNFFWITTSGNLITTHGSWDYDAHNIWFTQTDEKIPTWQQDALLFTSRTDALVLRTSFETHTVSIIADGKLIESIAPSQAQTVLTTLTTPSGRKENYEAAYKTHTPEQPQP